MRLHQDRTNIQRGRRLATDLLLLCFVLAILYSTVPTLELPTPTFGGDNKFLPTPRRVLENQAIDMKWPSHCQDNPSDNAKRVLVTGSVGFIGYHTALALNQRGDMVIGLDNFNDYYPVILKQERDKQLTDKGIHTIEGNVTDGDLLLNVINACGITHVVHLAAQAGVRYAKDHPMVYVESNVEGSVALFDACRKAEGPPAIIYASSSSVYGSNTKIPFSEDDEVSHPTSLYGATKRSVELSASVYHRLFDLSMTGLRFFTVYGPMGRPDMAVFQFAKSILRRQPIKIFTSSNGKELARDFTYIDDIVSGIIGALDFTPASRKGEAHNEIFNLGNTHPSTVSEFVSSLERAMGREAEKVYVSLDRSGDVLFTHANVSKAYNSFGFEPSVGLDEGLKRFADWFVEYSARMSNDLWRYPN